MNGSRTGILAFTVIAAAIVLALLAVPELDGLVDPRTGKRLASSAVALNQVRKLGDVSQVLGALPALQRRWPEDGEIARVRRVLTLELTPPRKLDDDPRVARDSEAVFAPVADRKGGVDARAAALYAHHKTGKRAALSLFLDLAEQFGELGRPRARLRWLERARRDHAGDPTLALTLARTQVAIGRLQDALDVTTVPISAKEFDASAESSPELLALRADVAAWLGRAAVEVEALERGLSESGDPEIEARLVALHEHLGQPHRAVPHAVRIAQRSGEFEDREKAMELALRAGVPEVAFEILFDFAADDPVRWLPRFAELAEQDQRIDLAIRNLEHLQRLRPSRENEDRLIALFRRSGEHHKLARALVARFEADPREYRAGFEAVELLLGVGRREEAEAFDKKLRASLVDPAGFFAEIREMHHARVPALGAIATAMAKATELHPSELSTVLEHLRPFALRRRYQPAVEALLTRFPADPVACAFRLDLIDALPTTTAQVEVLFALTEKYPTVIPYAERLVQRTVWLDERQQQLRARRLLLQRAPDNDANREAMAILLDATGRADEALSHWRYLASQEDASITAMVRYVRAVVAQKDVPHDGSAYAWLQRRARGPGSTPEDRLTAADLLFELQHSDAAREMYLAYLEDDPDHPRSLLRAGLLLSWAHEADRALPLLKRRLEVSEEEKPRVHFHLGEALFATGERVAARKEYEAALVAMQAELNPDIETERRIAKGQFRLGKFVDAERTSRSVLARAPDRADLHLDLVTLLLERSRFAEAEEHLAAAKKIDPNSAGVLRSEALLALRQQRYALAQSVLRRCLESYGADAGIYAQLGEACERAGDYPAALDAYRRWLALQQDSVAAGRATARMGDRVADLTYARFATRSIGDDDSLESTLGFSLGLGESGRFFGAVGHASYSGRAAVFAAGLQDVEADTVILDLGIGHRLGVLSEVGAGVMLHPGVEGDPVGAWVDVHLRGTDPYWSLELRAYAKELLTNPIAAAGLEGRGDGVELRGFTSWSAQWWSGFELKSSKIGIRHPATRTWVDDELFGGHANIGCTWLNGEQAVSERFRSRRVPPGPISPHLLGAESGKFRLSTWLTYQAIRLRGDEALLPLLPLGNRFDYVLASARVDRKIATGLGMKLEAYVGTDIRGAGSVWGADLRTTLRTSHSLESSFSVGLGDQLGSTDSDPSVYLDLDFTWRW